MTSPLFPCPDLTKLEERLVSTSFNMTLGDLDRQITKFFHPDNTDTYNSQQLKNIFRNLFQCLSKSQRKELEEWLDKVKVKGYTVPPGTGVTYLRIAVAIGDMAYKLNEILGEAKHAIKQGVKASKKASKRGVDPSILNKASYELANTARRDIANVMASFPTGLTFEEESFLIFQIRPLLNATPNIPRGILLCHIAQIYSGFVGHHEFH